MRQLADFINAFDFSQNPDSFCYHEHPALFVKPPGGLASAQ
jgi:hypothetical protein